MALRLIHVFIAVLACLRFDMAIDYRWVEMQLFSSLLGLSKIDHCSTLCSGGRKHATAVLKSPLQLSMKNSDTSPHPQDPIPVFAELHLTTATVLLPYS